MAICTLYLYQYYSASQRKHQQCKWVTYWCFHFTA